MCNKMVTNEIRKISSRACCQNSYNFPDPLGVVNYENFDRTQVKIFPNFTSIPFDYLL